MLIEQTLGKSNEDVLPQPIRGGKALTTEERRKLDLSSKIKGWGSDLDMSVRPGVPMDKKPDLGIETLYPDFEPQIPKALVNKSTEHAKMPPVFGNACPPRGLSGIIRNYAFGFSEGRLSHWLLLMLADRVDMVEEIFIDLSKGEIPNIPHEMGIRSELKYNKVGFAKKVAVAGLAVTALVLLARSRKAPQQA